MKTEYDVDYFIVKFQAIPENEIGTTQSSGCAYGQCQSHYGASDGADTLEGRELKALLLTLPRLTPSKSAQYLPHEGTPARINNGEIAEYQQPTPKQRILAALMDIKAMQTPKVEPAKVVYKTVVIDTKVKQLTETELSQQ